MQLYLESVPRSFTAETIAKTFYNMQIACVKRMLIMSRNAYFNRVYLEVDYWRETKEASWFLNGLEVYGKTRLYLETNVWWNVTALANGANMFLHATRNPTILHTVLYREFKQDSVDYSSKSGPIHRVGLTVFVDEYDFPVDEDKTPTYASVLKAKAVVAPKPSQTLKQTLLLESAKKSLEAVEESKKATATLEAVIEQKKTVSVQTSAMDIVNHILSKCAKTPLCHLFQEDNDLEQEMRVFNEAWVDDLVRPMPALIPFWDM